MTIKKVCMFCGRSHKKKPKLCRAKTDIMNGLKMNYPIRDILYSIEIGVFDLDQRAKELLSKGIS